MTTEPLNPLEEEPDQNVEERFPDEDQPDETPNRHAEPDPAIPPPEPTNG